MKVIAPFLIALLLISCTFNEESPEKKAKAKLPSIVLDNATYVLGQRDQQPIDIVARKITFYSDDNNAILEDFSFQQKDDDGVVVLEGSALYGNINTSSKVMNLNGDVNLRQSSQNMEIEADELMFDSENEEISSTGFVMVKSENGSFSGYGFNGDLIEQAYSFESIEQGTIEN